MVWCFHGRICDWEMEEMKNKSYVWFVEARWYGDEWRVDLESASLSRNGARLIAKFVKRSLPAMLPIRIRKYVREDD